MGAHQEVAYRASGMLTSSEITSLRNDKKRIAAEAKTVWSHVLSKQAHSD